MCYPKTEENFQLLMLKLCERSLMKISIYQVGENLFDIHVKPRGTQEKLMPQRHAAGDCFSLKGNVKLFDTLYQFDDSSQYLF